MDYRSGATHSSLCLGLASLLVGRKKEKKGWPQPRVTSVHPDVSFQEWERGPTMASQAFARIKHFW